MKADNKPSGPKRPWSLIIPLAALLSLMTVLWMFVVVSSCGGVDMSATVADQETAASGTSTGKTETREVTVDSIEKAVSRIRGLPVLGEVKVSYISREELQQELKKELEKENPVEELGAEEEMLRALGLLGESEVLSQEITELLGEGVAGYYDDEAKELKVVSDTSEITSMNEVVLAHELTHAIQDQHFDLQHLMGDEGNSDRDLAIMSLVEGDATLVEQQYTSLAMSPMDQVGAVFGALGEMGGMSPAPVYLLDTLEFPYLSGADFVYYLYDQAGWEAVNEAYEHPPQSTEQIMHPEKYLKGEAPVAVAIPDLSDILDPSWTPENEEVVGEFDVLELLATEIAMSDARRAAAGWAGGSFRYYSRSGQQLILMSLKWDTPADASEFANALAENLQYRYQTKFDTVAAIPVMSTPDGVWALVQHGDMVLSVMAPDAGTASEVAGRLAGLG